MTGAPYRHIGGAVIADHGTIALAEVRALIAFYEREARFNLGAGASGAARLCGERALALQAALEAARLWRRAAGWRDPEAADRRWQPTAGLPWQRSW